MVEAKRKISRKDYIAKLQELTYPSRDGGVMAAATNLPFDAFVAWRERKKGDPWPENAPWSADSPWAKLAMIDESEGASLALSCNFIMLEEQKKGNGRPLAQWLAAGWTPAAFVLKHLAGVFSPEDAPLNLEGERITAERGKRGSTEGKRSGATINRLVRDNEIARRFQTLFDCPGAYLSAAMAVSKEFGISESKARNTYAAYIKRMPRRNATD